MGKDKKKSIIVLIVAVLALALLVFVDLFGVAGKFKAKDIRLGLDLRGGASITYEVKGKVSEQDIKDTISKLSKRVESYSTEANLTLYAIWYKTYSIGETVTVGGDTFKFKINVKASDTEFTPPKTLN